jgi:hypothetical protein
VIHLVHNQGKNEDTSNAQKNLAEFNKVHRFIKYVLFPLNGPKMENERLSLFKDSAL